MRLNGALAAFASLAQPTRLRVFRLLIEYGSSGTPAGKLADRLGVPQNTLSFHLAHLTRAGLACARRDGKQILYSANCETVESLVHFLKENCCVLEEGRTLKDPVKRCARVPERKAT